MPLLQVRVPLALEQARPQAPQLARSLEVGVSQPLPLLPSQFPKPAGQAMVQEPATQSVRPTLRSQTLAQLPQLLASVAMRISQPLAATASQSA